jgi:septal ring factor EnvC (AmiA/AmiB activator)
LQTVSQTEKLALEKEVEGLKRELADAKRALEPTQREVQRLGRAVETLQTGLEDAQVALVATSATYALVALKPATLEAMVARAEAPDRHESRHLRALMVLARVYTTGANVFHENRVCSMKATSTPQEMTWAEGVNRGLRLCYNCEKRLEKKAAALGLKAS